MNPYLSVRIRTTAVGVAIELAGDLDNDSVEEARAALLRLGLRPGQQLIFDLGGLTFCDSSGITLLIAARNHALAAGASIALAAVPESVSRIFRITGLDQVFATHPTARDAEAAVGPGTATPTG